MAQVVAALSGGVDSSTAAAVLCNQGYEVTGLTLWLMKGKGQCCSEGMVDAARICEQLGISHHVLDSRDVFQENIVDYLVAGYAVGSTPLPCSRCNKAVKFGPMQKYAREQWGISTVATGHYARLDQDPQSGRYRLRRALDLGKDQSYFLYELSQDLLAGSMFPLGNCTKAETRRAAAEYGLATADKPESMDLCLVESHGSMRQFLDQYISPSKGDIVDAQGKILGQHEGVHHYTIGQRKGLGIAAAEPLYVIGLDAGRNRVIVGGRDSAQGSECSVQLVNWVAMAEPSTPIQALVQVRYRSQPTEATIIPLPENRARIVFSEPQFGVTPGQAAVWYQPDPAGDLVLGGGLIEP
ncbi:tRNA 2-thiouridine(34) synthase MnmA [Leptolyngbya sp. FACHB-261]|uniref:tRNA 2-thiouridine(34) synthase MnmA n=1 Tax=Leptolyngbya sp. FACHB-261 TaxID=2692806 RepID=UPI0016834116|nr:tRNA 2-thiouridine(34) synthase MnmA [Leptolyngbya sp. FACHB-261]MBD2100915.1 tRNA 2-thiouridine(34) synthase MnmA [Leptolyngbya sp. FACHB-261]